MEPRVRIGETNVSTRISAIEALAIYWAYNEASISYNEEGYSYDGIMTISLFKPRVNIVGKIPRLRID